MYKQKCRTTLVPPEIGTTKGWTILRARFLGNKFSVSGDRDYAKPLAARRGLDKKKNWNAFEAPMSILQPVYFIQYKPRIYSTV